MFENLLIAQKPRHPGRARVVLGLSVSLHVVLVLFLIIQGFWTIEKLDPPNRTLTLALAPPLPPPPAPAKASKKIPPPKITKKIVKRVVKPVDLTQPVVPKKADPDVQVVVVDMSEGVEGGLGEGLPGGMSTGAASAMLDSMGGMAPGGMLDAPPPPPPRRMAPPPPPKQVPPKAVEQQRISGDTHVEPDRVTKEKMVLAGESKLVFIAKMCLNSHGNVASTNVLRSSGYPMYDQKILSTVRQWRYQPFLIDGKAVAVCSAVTFVYRQQ